MFTTTPVAVTFVLALTYQFSFKMEKLRKSKPRRPGNEDQEDAFLKVCRYLETNDDEKLTISHVQEKMEEFLERRFTIIWKKLFERTAKTEVWKLPLFF